MSPPTAITTGDLARRLDAVLLGAGDVEIRQLDAVELARPGSLTFVRSARYARQFATSAASAALIPREAPLADLLPGFDPASPAYPRPLLVVPDVDLALIRCADAFAPPPPHRPPGVHPSAFVDPTASVDPAAHVGPQCVVMAHARLDAHAVLVASVFVGEHTRVGEHSTLHPGVRVLERCVVGRRCILQANAVVGADGFGFRPAPDGRGFAKIPHIGNVVIDDDVEIGACSCVDRAKFGSTTVGAGTKIDNQVQIAHGCRVGRSVLLCGQVGLSGSVVLGDGVIIGGKSGVADNVEIGAGSRIGAHAGVTGNVPPKSTYLGMPAGPASEWRRAYAYLRRVGKRASHHGDAAP